MRLTLVGWFLVFVIWLRGAGLAAQEMRAGLLAADKHAAELSVDSGLSRTLEQTLHPTGTLLWPGAPVLPGAGAVKQWAGTRPDIDSLRLTWQPLGLELSRDSSLGVTWGVAIAIRQAATNPPRIGRYIAAWRRDGKEWAITALMLAGIVAPAMAPARRGLPLTLKPLSPTGSAAPFIAADLAFARLAGDSGAGKAFETWAADEGMSFGGGGLLIRGPKPIGQAVSGPERWLWHPVAAGAARSGDLGWTAGEAVIGAGGAEPAYSKYLTIWRRDGGQPRFLLDGGNGRPPAPWRP